MTTNHSDDIITQIHLALGKGYRLAAVIGALTGGGVTYCTHAMARGDLASAPWTDGNHAAFLGYLALVLGGLLFSIVTTYGFGRSAFGSGWLAVGFLVLMDGVMIATTNSHLEWFATGLLIAIEAITTGCTVARGRLATLARRVAEEQAQAADREAQEKRTAVIAAPAKVRPMSYRPIGRVTVQSARPTPIALVR